MRVLIINTSEKTGGAAVAAHRLMESLNNNGVKTKMLVRDKETECITVAAMPNGWLNQWRFLWERFVIFVNVHFSRKHLFEIDIANVGADVTKTREFKEADVIHLNWVNQGMLSLRGIRKILDSKKPVVWTMHDIWPATSICHYTRGCGNYVRGCHNCKLLPGGGGTNDLSAKVWLRKKKMLNERNIFFVTCSKWLANEAKRSALLVGQNIVSIPNTIDTHIFNKKDKKEARMMSALPLDKKIILFVSQRVTDHRKGMTYFVEAINKMAHDNPEMSDTTVIAILGGHAEDIADQLALPVFPLGYVSDEKKIVNVYNSADVFVLPSLEDNLPNTIMESMACGVPCVGFNIGGIPEMIDHKKNGYVAAFRDVNDLAHGIRWVISEADYDALSCAAQHKVAVRYSQNSVAMKYIEVYNQAMAFKGYSL